MYELYALTAGEGLTLLLAFAAHGAVIGYLARRGWLAVPRPTPVAVAAVAAAQKLAVGRHERKAA